MKEDIELTVITCSVKLVVSLVRYFHIHRHTEAIGKLVAESTEIICIFLARRFSQLRRKRDCVPFHVIFYQQPPKLL